MSAEAKRRDLHTATRDLAYALHLLVAEIHALTMAATTIGGLGKLTEHGAHTAHVLVGLALTASTTASGKSKDLLSALDALGEMTP